MTGRTRGGLGFLNSSMIGGGYGHGYGDLNFGSISAETSTPGDGQNDVLVVTGKKLAPFSSIGNFDLNTFRANACESLTHRIGTGLEYTGKGLIYSGLTIAVISGPKGAGAGLTISSAGSYVSTVGQVFQDIAFKDYINLVGRLVFNAAGGRIATSVVPSSVRSQFGDTLVNTVVGEGGSYLVTYLDPDRC